MKVQDNEGFEPTAPPRHANSWRNEAARFRKIPSALIIGRGSLSDNRVENATGNRVDYGQRLPHTVHTSLAKATALAQQCGDGHGSVLTP